MGWGPIDLPELELQTTAYWITAEGAGHGWRRDDLDVALVGSGRAIQAVASVLLMVDPRDLGLVAQVRSPHQEAPTIYLYEAVPGGNGLSERLWERHDELVARPGGTYASLYALQLLDETPRENDPEPVLVEAAKNERTP